MFGSLPVITTPLWKKCSVACQVPFCVLNGLQRETQIVWWGWLFCCPNPKSRVWACHIRLWLSDRWGYLWNEADLPPVEGEWEGLPLHLHRRLCDRLESEPLRCGEIWNTAMWVTVSWLALAGTESITWAPPMPWVPRHVMGYPSLITDALGSRQGVGPGHIGVGAQCEPTEEWT